MDKQTLILSGVAAIVGGLIVLVFSGLVGNQSDGPAVGASGTRFPNGISVDSTSPSAGQIRGTTFTSTGAATFASGIVTGDLTVDSTTLYVDSTNNDVGIGTTSPQTFVHFEEGNSVATSTLFINSASTTATGARIILEDTDGAGCSEITILNGTVVSKTVTCP